MAAVSREYNYNVSKAMDTSFYMVMYFYESEVLSYFRDRFDNVEEGMRTYLEFKEKHKADILPEAITPFLYTNYDKGMRGFLTRYLDDNLSHQSCTKDDILALLNNKELMKRQFLKYVVPKADDEIVAKLMQYSYGIEVNDAINNMAFDEKTKLHMKALVYDFDEIHRVLVETFMLVHGFVDELYDERQDIIEEIKRQINDKDYGIIERLRAVYKFSDTIKSLPFHFSIFNSYLVKYVVHKDKVCFGLGLYFRDVISSERPKKHISLQEYHKFMSNPVSFKIVHLALEYKKLSIPSMVEILGISNNTVRVNVEKMVWQDLLIHVEPPATVTAKTARIFYKINPEYFNVLHAETEQLKIKANNVHKEGIDGHVTRKGNQKKRYQENRA